jgi:acetoacetyl-CoA synthetase
VNANTVELRDWLRRHRQLNLADYEALRRWSVEHISDFWQAMWDYFALQSPTRHERALDDAQMPGARWFEGAQLNYVSQLLRHVEASDAAGAPAIVFRNEWLQREGRSEELTWKQLADSVAALAATLVSLGVVRGDRVAAYLPNIPETIVGFLACASLGAVWSLCAPDMGMLTVRDRFRQIAPRVLLAGDGGVYGGKRVDRRDTVRALVAELPTVETLILVPYLERAGAVGPFAFDAGSWRGRVLGWGDALATREWVAPRPMPFAHPLWIVYSSGTTGLPKPIVHGHGGVVLEMLKLHRFHLNLQPSATSDERFHWYSSSGWVMWNLSISALLGGTTVCLYDGHPSFPAPDTLWRYAADLNVTTLGAGAAYYTACCKAGLVPRRDHDLSRLRTLGSTGSPLPPEAYVWGTESVRDDIWWAVISGGTDLASAFLGGTPELPTVPGEMQARCLGADVHTWDEAGRDVHDEVGELVCLQPMPSMPLYFWGDDDGRRYRDSYFDVYPNVWRHGDWLKLTPAGGAIIYGRSDATLNRHGHRVGTSELYRAVEALPAVVDSLVVDIEYLGRPSWMPLFVVLAAGRRLDDALRTELRQSIRDGLSPRFVPDDIIQVAEIPRTLTGKKQELPVKKLLLGRVLGDVVNKDACANPQAFDAFVAYAQQRNDSLQGSART